MSTLGPSDLNSRQSLLAATEADLAQWFAQQGEPRYRAEQVLRWVFEKSADSFESMTDLPARLRLKLQEYWRVFETRIAHRDTAPDGTVKLLIECIDKRSVECVLMNEANRRTVCISTQVGCGMGCVFCASGLNGLVRNLSTVEILEQVLHARNALPDHQKLTHIVVMGMGESLANLDALIPALDRLCSTKGLGISQRRVTISTVGLPEKIHRLAELDRNYPLAVSLHAATESLRDQLVPINRQVGLKPVLEAADAYFHRTGRQVTFEYTLLGGINDRPEDSEALARLLTKRKAHVNLIPYNPVPGLPYHRPAVPAVDAFVARLKRTGVSVTVRQTKGRPIDAACGQLRRQITEDLGLSQA